ncbi:glucagon-like peptide 2 receptor [Rhinatrema bivittatum]|uniref:glucagon-like peptide 2 receptor n=1 Tax=Rhinatrema bivittatum TaxID=194408 RepID=UPI001126026F|nr:glucagon-like peptide 2 receptor [Rhinatrema bivittatum]
MTLGKRHNYYMGNALKECHVMKLQVSERNSPECPVRGDLLEETLAKWSEYKEQCNKKLESDRTIKTGIYCNGTFDQFACWPHSLPGNVSVPCPWYLPWVESGTTGYVHRYCSHEGIWQKGENSTDIWRDHSECSEKNHFKQTDEQHAMLSTLRLLYTIGYSVSLVALVLALLVLLMFRNLHCTRNFIHINLFASFIFRALVILIKDIIDHNTYSKIPNDESGWLSYFTTEISTMCRVVPALMHYFVGANFFWLLVEGIYLHTLLVSTSPGRPLLYRYVLIGWGVPLVCVTLWAITRRLYENNECWGRIIQMGIWWIIRGPLLFAITVNFILFLNILRLLLAKLRAQQMHFTDYKYRLARSTLFLIPLLGIHEFAFTFITDDQINGHSMHIRLFVQLTLSSFQGFVVAALYCFVNGEVKAETPQTVGSFLASSHPREEGSPEAFSEITLCC